MNIKLKAVLYTIGYFVSMAAASFGILTVIPYLQPWMGWGALFAFLFFTMYNLVLSGMKFDESVDKIRGDLTEIIEKK